MMTAQVLDIQAEPDWQAISDWAASNNFNLQQVDCLIALMLKILDGKCKMDADTQTSVQLIYQQAHRHRSHLFDERIHGFIANVCHEPAPLSLRQVHELRRYAEDVIPRTVMKGFKQYLWANMP
jgi:hypothetical protein